MPCRAPAREWQNYEILKVIELELPECCDLRIKFDLDDEHKNISLWLGDTEVVCDFCIEGLPMPDELKVSIMAATGGLNNRHCVEDIRIQGECEW